MLVLNDFFRYNNKKVMNMKKIAFFLTCCFILVTIPATTFAYEIPENVKIGLYFGSTAKQNVQLAGESGFVIGYEQGRTATNLFELTDVNQLDVTMDIQGQYHVQLGQYYNTFAESKAQCLQYANAGISCYPAVIDGYYYVLSGLYNSLQEAQSQAAVLQSTLGVAAKGMDALYNSYKIKVQGTADILCLFASGNTNLIIKSRDGITSVDGNKYRGYILFLNNTATTNVINLVDMETYVATVIAKEMSPSWPMESLKAQAVCARSFTCRNLNKYSSYGFDLDTTQASQVYGGYSAEAQSCIDAANATKGQVLTYNGTIAETVYFSTSGGSTEDAKNVWGGDVPYLVSVDDPYEPTDLTYSNWTVELTPEEIKSILSSKGVNIGDITSIEVTEFTPANRVYIIKITGTQGSKEYSKEAARTFLGDKLKSQYYTVTAPGSGVMVKSERGVVKTDIFSGFLKSIEGIQTISGNLYAKSAGGAVSPVSSSSSDKYVFSGKGWGHGVGMSQWGAYGMAQNGFTYDQILYHYYTGTQLSS